MKTIFELKAKAVVEGLASLHVNGNTYTATDVRGKVFVAFNGERIAADKAQTVLDFDNATVEAQCDDKGPFPVCPSGVTPNFIALDIDMPSGVHCTGHVDYNPASVISNVSELKDLPPGTYTVTGKAAQALSQQMFDCINSIGGNNRHIDKERARVKHVATVRIADELAKMRKRYGYKIVSDENGIRYEATKIVRRSVVTRIAKLKRMLDMSRGRKPGPLWVYEIENSGRHYGFTDNWIRKPKFHGWY